MEKVVSEGSQWVKDIQQISWRYDTARTKGRKHGDEQNKFIYYNIDTWRISLILLIK